MAVQLLKLDGFLQSIGTAIRPQMDMSIYHGAFDCACGNSHAYGPHIDLLCEGSMRVVMVCPNDRSYMTNVAIKTFLLVKFRGFASIAGWHAKTPEVLTAAHSVFNELR